MAIQGKSDHSVKLWLECENTRHGFRERPDNPLATYTEFPALYRPGADSYELPLYAVAATACRIFRSLHPDFAKTNRAFPLLKKKPPLLGEISSRLEGISV